MKSIQANRLAADQYQDHFGDLEPPLDDRRAALEASRCYFCFDAPCVEACPTGIDIPSFIRKIQTSNRQGSAMDILSANIFGGACARVCPTEILCEEACVRNLQEEKPVEIGLLQRYATEESFEGPHPFTRAAPTNKTIAVVGGGPAGLTCAHGLARHGHEVTVFEAKDKLGGLNEYGIAAYKMADDFAAKEVSFVLAIGGITVRTGMALGHDITLDDLRAQFDAVFLSVGLGDTRPLDIAASNINNIEPAVHFIERLRQSDDLSSLPIGDRVVVIGGGNTAIDASVQSKRLGAREVTLVYRRGASSMSATGHEQHIAQTNGVTIRHWLTPKDTTYDDKGVTGVTFEYTKQDADGMLTGTGETHHIDADMVLLATGQTMIPPAQIKTNKGKIVVDEGQATSLPGVWAGGDCTALGQDLTVQAVQEGKIAAQSIHTALSA
ncbi:MAG: NAD(P)-dependent oxidoreductase [Pseudomonadota bacterium]